MTRQPLPGRRPRRLLRSRPRPRDRSPPAPGGAARRPPRSAPSKSKPRCSKEASSRAPSIVAKPYENPFGTLLALYMVIKDPKLGILVKQPLARSNPTRRPGSSITTVDEHPPAALLPLPPALPRGRPQPADHPAGLRHLHHARRDRSPPGSTPATALDRPPPRPSRSLSGPDGGPCPTGGAPPFHPGFEAGSLNNAAGSYSPFDMRLTRSDGEQDMTRFSAVLPPGVVGKLAGVAKCPDAAIAAAKAAPDRTAARKSSTAPPARPASQIGRTLAGAGVGSPAHLRPRQALPGRPLPRRPAQRGRDHPGRGRPLRPRHRRRPRGPDASTRKPPKSKSTAPHSDPIPHILKGIPLNVRDLRVYVDRPELHPQPDQLRTDRRPRRPCSAPASTSLDPADDVPVGLSSPLPGRRLRPPRLQAEARPEPQGRHQARRPPGPDGRPHPAPGRRQHRQRLGHPAALGLPRPGPHPHDLHPGAVRRRAATAPCPAASIYGHAKALHPAARRTARRPGLPALLHPQPARPGRRPARPGRHRPRRPDRLDQGRHPHHLRSASPTPRSPSSCSKCRAARRA